MYSTVIHTREAIYPGYTTVIHTRVAIYPGYTLIYTREAIYPGLNPIYTREAIYPVIPPYMPSPSPVSLLVGTLGPGPLSVLKPLRKVIIPGIKERLRPFYAVLTRK